MGRWQHPATVLCHVLTRLTGLCLQAAAAAAAEAPSAAAGEQAPEQADKVVGEDEVWRMDPEELFSWNGFPDIDLRSVVDRIRSSSCSAFRSSRD